MENIENTIKVLAATGIPALDEELSQQKGLEVVECYLKAEVENEIEAKHPQLIIISDKLSGNENTIKLLIHLKNKYHFIRFIYLAGQLDPRDKARVDALGMLVLCEIYDIIISQKMNIDVIMDIIKYPQKEQTVSYLTKNLLNSKYEIQNGMNGLEYEMYDDTDVKKNVFPNVFMFTSVKPGTGKSFMSANVACAIAKYGKNRPKVALVEADMQTLSLGTLLAIDEKKGCLRDVMQAVSTIFDKNTLIDDDDKKRRVNRIIKNSMVSYKNVPNLDVLVGSSLTPEEIDSLSIIPEYFTYILSVLKDEYDYVIIDTNSSIFHVSSFQIAQKAQTCYYIINLDFNNIRNNIRYANMLKEIGIFDKVQYILNENIENTKEFYSFGVVEEELSFTSDDIEEKYFHLIAKVPMLPKTVFLNRLYEGVPVVLDKNGVAYTNRVKLELMKIANDICPLDDSYTNLQKIVEGTKKKFSFADLFKKKKQPVKKQTQKPKTIDDPKMDEERTEELNQEGAHE